MAMYLVTGAAGFIGFHLSLKLLEKNKTVIGLDNINDYYGRKIKYDRIKISIIRLNNISTYIIITIKKLTIKLINYKY